MKKIICLSLILIAVVFDSFAQGNFNIDVFPTNIGGKAELKRVFEEQLIYPEHLLKEKTVLKVTFNFVIRADSSATDIKITSSGAPEIDEEALRIFKLLQWVPAIKSNQNVSVNWIVTFEFDPKRYAKICRNRGFDKPPFYADAKKDSSGVIYKSPDQMPMYQKGAYALQDFIKENLEYPKQAQLANLQGVVVLRFIVEPSGLITNIGIEKSVGGGCDQEAIRVLQLIKWYPGKKNDKFSRVQMSFPFYFILNDEFHDNSGGEQK
ncbi:MAG: energy transducer TonB [Bacteroidota bacterium]